MKTWEDDKLYKQSAFSMKKWAFDREKNYVSHFKIFL